MQISDKAERQAHATSRLTQLAFVFLPLTFVTGVFGMNVKPFTDGAPIWQFWVSVACIAVPAFLFGLQTAREDIRDKLRALGFTPSEARQRMRSRLGHAGFTDAASKAIADWTVSRVPWHGTVTPRSGEWANQYMTYEDFLRESLSGDVLLGVGVRAFITHVTLKRRGGLRTLCLR